MLLTEASGDLSWQLFASELVDSQSACPLPARRAAFGFGRPGRKDPDDPRPAIADIDAGLLRARLAQSGYSSRLSSARSKKGEGSAASA